MFIEANNGSVIRSFFALSYGCEKRVVFKAYDDGEFIGYRWKDEAGKEWEATAGEWRNYWRYFNPPKRERTND